MRRLCGVAARRSSADLIRAAEGAAGAAASGTALNRAGTNSKRAQDADKDRIEAKEHQVSRGVGINRKGETMVNASI
jgi:type II secretory pathway component PulM